MLGLVLELVFWIRILVFGFNLFLRFCFKIHFIFLIQEDFRIQLIFVCQRYWSNEFGSETMCWWSISISQILLLVLPFPLSWLFKLILMSSTIALHWSSAACPASPSFTYSMIWCGGRAPAAILYRTRPLPAAFTSFRYYDLTVPHVIAIFWSSGV